MEGQQIYSMWMEEFILRRVLRKEGRRAELGYLRRYAAQYQKSLQFIREVKSPENAEGFSYR